MLLRPQSKTLISPKVVKKVRFGEISVGKTWCFRKIIVFLQKFLFMEKLVGREFEISELRRCYESNRSEFIIIYGRRRVGKTFLIDKFFHNTYDFTYVGGHNLTTAKQLKNFAKAMKKAQRLPHVPKYNDWSEAFDDLEEYLESLPDDKRKVVFIDEMPWMDTPGSEFVESLEVFWNGWAARRSDIVFVASGSATSWMVDKLVENQGGLHARITNNIYIRPFTLQETEVYLRNANIAWSRYEILQSYMIFGGIPFYLSLLNKNQSLVQNIDRLFFRKNGELRVEFYELYHALFRRAGMYIDIVHLLAQHREGMTRNEILKASGIEGKTLTTVLRNLERCDFIICYSQYGNKKKDAIFRLVDFYTLFYYKFIDGDNSKDESWWSGHFQSHDIEQWEGTTFELICITHIPQIKKALGIHGLPSSAYSWRAAHDKENGQKGAQIDLVIERSDHTIHLCEMKFCRGKYRINEAYEQRLRERMETFRTKTQTHDTLLHTMITTFGLADGVHTSIIHSQATMENLFER